MNGDISIDVGSAIPYAIDQMMSLFGKDSSTIASLDRLKKLISVSIEQASTVQCVGMDKPIPINEIYQQTKLREREFYYNKGKDTNNIMDIFNLIYSKKNAIIRGLPGSGKTILMHWTLLKLHTEKDFIPLLITLRRPNSIDDLSFFIKTLSNTKVIKNKKVILLVDGYDEIDFENRKIVSQLLNEFIALKRGNYFLTCRLYYTIIDLNAPYYYINSFNQNDAIKFVNAFFKIYGIESKANDLLVELKNRGFNDYLSSPLLLSLICVLKSGPLPNLPKNTLGLIRRALETLTFRWDEKKGIYRSGDISIDGDERIRCLMRIAFDFKQLIQPESLAYSSTEQHLKIIQRSDVNPAKFLSEIAQWYGIFVPTSEGQWAFVHRTIHDFLAARFWVESGLFLKGNIANWDTRGAYAACLVPDATEYLQHSLLYSHDLYVLIECLSNNAPFDTKIISKAVIDHFDYYPDGTRYKKTKTEIFVECEHYFIHLVSNDFLYSLIETSKSNINKRSNVIVYCLCLSEIKNRNISLDHILKEFKGIKLYVNRSKDSFYIDELIR